MAITKYRSLTIAKCEKPAGKKLAVCHKGQEEQEKSDEKIVDYKN